MPLGEYVGRSHRSKGSISILQEVIDLQKKILKLPSDYQLGLVAGSSTGAMETLLWSLLGARGVDIISHCVFSEHWKYDIVSELKLNDVRVFRGEFPQMADIKDIGFDRDVVFCWTSTTSGTSFQDASWIKSHRKGLTICDASSAVFAFEFDWEKLDAVAFSWQKVLGGEPGIGNIILSPRAIERLNTHNPTWPIPRIFRLSSNPNVFKGYTINTPSMICVEEFRNNLRWAESIGGQKGLCKKIEDNYATVKKWIDNQNVFRFLVDEKSRARHIACFDIQTEFYKALSEEEKWNFLKKILALGEQERVGFDFLGHSLTKPHLRVWCGPTVETSNLELFLPWLEHLYKEALHQQ
jgi:phosphoserine aminotransferase